MRHFVPSSAFQGRPNRFGSNFYGDAEEESKGSWTDYVPVIRDVLFGENARVKAAGMRERIEGLRVQAENSTGFFHNAYVLEMQKLEAKLVELEQMAEEEEEAAQAASIAKMALAIAAVIGVVAVAGFAITQVQKARLLQVKIKKTQTGR